MNKFMLVLSIFYGAIFIHVGFFMPFFSVWLESIKLNSLEISIILATPLFMRVIFTPIISFISDRSGNHVRTIQFLAWGTLFSLSLLFVANGFLQILIISAIFSIFWTSVMPLAEAIAMKGVRNEGLDYGRMRLWGSLTFICASSFGGIILAKYGPSSALWLFAIAALTVLCASYTLSSVSPGNGNGEQSSAEPVQVKHLFEICRSPVFLFFLIGASTIQASHAVLYGFGSIHWKAQGISEGVIGVLWAIGVIAETVLFAFSSRVVGIVGAANLLLLGAGAGVIRWTIMAFDPSMAVLFPLQVLHGLTFGAGHLGAIILIGNLVPERYSATAQGLYAALSMGFIMGLAMLASGPLYDLLSGGAYLPMAGVSLLSLITLVIFIRLWDEKHIALDQGKQSRLSTAK
ncbi:MAG: MFS transporter [Methyloligellaceae bacterium]